LALVTRAAGSPPPVMRQNDGGRNGAVASAAEPALVHIAGGVLGSYAAAAQRSGRCPLPAGQSAEAAAVLDALIEVRAGAAEAPLGGTLSAVAACVTAGTGEVRCLSAGLLRSLEGAAVGAA